jgi:hypothetical protein
MSERECERCAVRISGAVGHCPICGRRLVAVDTKPTGEATINFALAFTVLGCDCGNEFVHDGTGVCPSCGDAALESDERVVARLDAYGARLTGLLDETRDWREDPLQFADRGARPTVHEHLQRLKAEAMSRPGDLLGDAADLLNTVQWDAPDVSATQSGFDKLLDTCHRFTDLIAGLTKSPPPLGLLAVHRQATRAVAATGRAVVGFATTLRAESHTQAREQMDEAQAHLDLATRRVYQVGLLLRRAAALLDSPGFWAIDDQYDTGRIAWEGVDQQISSVADAARIVRETFADVPGVSGLPDEHALALMPAAAVGASLQDPERLIERAVAARKILDHADRHASSWITDPALLVQLVWRGHRQLVDQVVRLGHAIRVDTPRRLFMETALDVFAKFYEGPLRNLAGVVAIAADAVNQPGVTIDRGTVDHYRPKKTCDTLNDSTPVLLEGVWLALRHSEAHYDFELDDAGVTLNLLGTARGSSTSQWFSDDDFFEQLLNLNEALVAVELAVIPWLVTRPEDVVQGELELRSRNADTAKEALRALAGLKGWTDLEFTVEGETLRVHGVYRGPDDDEAALGLLPVVAAAWSLFDNIRQVDLGPAVNGDLVLSRDEFPPENSPGLIRQHQITQLIAKTLQAPEDADPEAVQARWILLPAVMLPVRAALDLLDDPHPQATAELAKYLAWSGSGFLDALTAPELVTAGEEIAGLLKTLRKSLGVWRTAGRAARLRTHVGQEMATTCQRMLDLAKEHAQSDEHLDTDRRDQA